MDGDHSLLAHLVPRLTSGVEDAATEALAIIFNRSKLCRAALVELLRDGEHHLAPLRRASTQVTVSDGGRLDLVAYDDDDSARLIIESKFWAALLSGQASSYVEHLAADGLATLLFVAPEVRRESLWAKIEKQFLHPYDLRLTDADDLRLAVESRDRPLRIAQVIGTDKRVALISWNALLKCLELADPSMAPNVRQLGTLANAQGDRPSAPLHAYDISEVPAELSESALAAAAAAGGSRSRPATIAAVAAWHATCIGASGHHRVSARHCAAILRLSRQTVLVADQLLLEHELIVVDPGRGRRRRTVWLGPRWPRSSEPPDPADARTSVR